MALDENDSICNIITDPNFDQIYIRRQNGHGCPTNDEAELNVAQHFFEQFRSQTWLISRVSFD